MRSYTKVFENEWRSWATGHQDLQKHWNLKTYHGFHKNLSEVWWEKPQKPVSQNRKTRKTGKTLKLIWPLTDAATQLVWCSLRSLEVIADPASLFWK